VKSIEKAKKYLIEPLKNNKIIILCVIGVLLFQIYYLIISTRNVPFMDYWRDIKDFGEKIMTGKFGFQDIWISTTSQRNPLIRILFAINMLVFNYNPQIEIFMGIFFQLLSFFIIIYAFNKENKENNKLIIFQFLSSTFLLAIFSLNQWEILTLEFSLSFMIRISCYILIFILLNYCLFDMQNNKKQLVIISIFLPIIICFLSQLYFIAFIGTIGIMVIMHFCINYKKDRFLYFKNYLYLGIAAIIGAIIYSINISGDLTVKNTISASVFIINLIKGTLLMFGASLCQHFSEYSFYNISGHTMIYLQGIVLAIIYIFALLIYIKKKMYLKTYIPLFLILYCFLSIIIIFYGRVFEFDLYYLMASRYTCETTLGLIGLLWIFANDILNNQNKTKIFSIISLLIIVFSLILEAYFEKNLDPSRGAYLGRIKDIMLNIDSASDEELIIFQASPIEVRSGINILKEYNLNIFHKENVDKLTQPNIKYSGFYDKGKNEETQWISGNASITFVNKAARHFSITGYYPENFPANSITVTINNDESLTKDIIPGNSFTLELDFKNIYDDVQINIKTEKSFIPKNEGWNNDERELGVLISKWSLSK